MPGAGAGGGMAAGLRLVGGQISSELRKFGSNRLRSRFKADLVVVGEGRWTSNLCLEKLLSVAKRTPEKIPVLAICGGLAEDLPAFPSHHIEAAFLYCTRSL